MKIKLLFFFVLLIGFQTFNLTYAVPQVTINQSPAQSDSPFTVKDSNNNILFQILSDGKATINEFIRLSADGLTSLRTYVFPDESGTIVLEDSPQTLTSKTIDADFNSITNIDDSEIKSGANIALSKLATDPLARASHTGTQTASTISDFDNQVILSRLDEMASPTSDVSINSQKLTNLGEPTSSTDAATKNYVDSVAQGLDIKQSVRVATTTDITLSGTQTIDGVSVIATNRVLVKDQTDPVENGIYVVSAGAWSRSTDADDASDVSSGMFTFVREGTTFADVGFVLVTDDPITPGITALTFTQFSGVPVGEVNTASNIVSDSSTQIGLVKAKSGTDLPFKVLREGANISLTTDNENATIAVTGAELTANKNAASGYAGLDGSSRIAKAQTPSDTVYTGDGQTLTSKTIDADSNSITNIDDDEIKTNAGISWTKISKTGSSIHDLANVTSIGCAAGQVLKSSASSWICANDIGEENTVSNVGTGSGVFKQKTSEDFELKSLIGTTGVVISSNTNDLTFSLASIPKGSISSTGTWTAAEIPNLDASKITTGTFAKSVQNSATVYNDQANTYTSGSKQTFSSSASTAGIGLTGIAGNPSGLANGDVWYDSTANKFKAREGGITKSIISNTVSRDYVRTGGTNWYSLNTGHTAPANTAVVTNVIRAFPLISGANGFSADRLAIDVGSSAGGSNCIVGIYTDTGNLYPSTKVVDGGVFSTATTGLKSATVSFSLNPGTLYWAVYNCSGTPSLRSHAVNSIPPVLGFTGAAGAGQNIVGLTAARTYDGTLPASFPAGATNLLNTNAPIILMRAS